MRKETIASKLILSTTAVLLIFFIGLAIIGSTTLKIGVSNIQTENMNRLTKSIKETIELSYDSKRTLIESYAKGAGMGNDLFYIKYGVPENTGKLKASLTKGLEVLNIADKTFENVFIVNDKGLVIASNATNSFLGQQVADQDYYNEIVHNRKKYFISPNVSISKSTGNPVIVIAQALFFNNIPVGFIAVTENINNIGESYILDKKIGKTGYTYLLSGKGQMLVNPDRAKTMKDWSSYNFIKEIISQLF